MIEESRLLIQNYEPDLSKSVWIEKIIENNILGKPTRSWIKEVVQGTFYPRYINGPVPDSWKDLKKIEQNNHPKAEIIPILYYITAKSDNFLYDYITTEIFNRFFSGRLAVSARDVYEYIQSIPDEKFNKRWSDYVKRRLSRGVMSTLRDFGILEGKGKKKIANYYLPLFSFVYIAFQINKNFKSGEKLLNHTDWKLFLLNTKLVERLFLEAHQHGYLNYHAAGGIVRIEFPYKDSEDIIDAISEKSTART